jgi:alkylated DNA repair dioxygenase AlkB
MESPTKRPKYSVALNGCVCVWRPFFFVALVFFELRCCCRPDVAVASADEEPIDPAWLLTHMEELDVLKQLHERSMQSRPLFVLCFIAMFVVRSYHMVHRPRALASLAEVKKTTLNDDIKVVGSLSEGFQLVRATRVDCPTPVSGLAMVEEFITSDEERSLMQLIDSSAWYDFRMHCMAPSFSFLSFDRSRTLSRRTQQYGFEYNYSQLNVRPAPTAPIPDLFLPIMQRLVDRGLFPRLPDQLIINEYEPGQGIAAHTDHEKFFGEPICSISMGSACTFCFFLLLLVLGLIMLRCANRRDGFHSQGQAFILGFERRPVSCSVAASTKCSHHDGRCAASLAALDRETQDRSHRQQDHSSATPRLADLSADDSCSYTCRGCRSSGSCSALIDQSLKLSVLPSRAKLSKSSTCALWRHLIKPLSFDQPCRTSQCPSYGCVISKQSRQQAVDHQSAQYDQDEGSTRTVTD